MRSRTRRLVAELEPIDERERTDRIDILDWIDSGAPLHRTAKPATPPKHLVSYCVLVDSESDSALLVDHLDAGLWLPTGGHVDPGEDAPDAASREIRGELAITPPFHPAIGPVPLMVAVTETQGRSLSHTDVSLWFVFTGSVEMYLHPDPGEFAATNWFRLEDIRHGPDTRFEPNLPRFVDKLARI